MRLLDHTPLGVPRRFRRIHLQRAPTLSAADLRLGRELFQIGQGDLIERGFIRRVQGDSKFSPSNRA